MIKALKLPGGKILLSIGTNNVLLDEASAYKIMESLALVLFSNEIKQQQKQLELPKQQKQKSTSFDDFIKDVDATVKDAARNIK